MSSDCPYCAISADMCPFHRPLTACAHDAESGTDDPDVWRCDGCGALTRHSTDSHGVLVRDPSQTSTPVDALPDASLVESSAQTEVPDA